MAEVAEPEATGSKRRVKVVIAIVVLIIGCLVVRSVNKKHVIAGLASDDAAARLKSAQTLMDSKSFTDTLARQTVPVKRLVIATLRQMNNDAAAGELITLMKDRNPTVQNEAQFALEAMPSVSIARLVGALGDPDLNLKNRAAAALIHIGQPILAPVEKDGATSVPLIDTISNGAARAGITRILTAVPQGAAPWLLKKLSDEKADAATKACAIDILGRISAQEAAAPIRALLNDPKVEPPIRAAALVSLGRLRHPEAFALLTAAATEADPAVKNTAIVGFGELGDPRAVGQLLQYLSGYNESLRAAAVASLSKIGATAIPALAAQMKNPGYQVRLGVLQSLEGINDPRAKQLVVSALKDADVKVRCEAASSLAKPGDATVVKPLVAALSDKEWRVANAAAESLVVLGAPAVPSLMALIGQGGDSRPAYYALNALERIGAPAVPALLATAQKGDTPASRRAVIALGGIGDARAAATLEKLSAGGVQSLRPLALRALKQVHEGRRVS